MSYAQSVDADMVVVGTRGYGAMRSAMLSVVGLGSVSQYLAHNLSCPTLLVKEKTHTSAAKNEDAKKEKRDAW